MSPKSIGIWMFVCIISVVGVALLLTAGQNPSPPAARYSKTQQERPIAETGQTSFDLGTIRVSDVQVQDFTLKNKGTKPLGILNINTSCGCTAGQLIYKGETSKEFSMHKKSGYLTAIAPGETATVRLTYRPASMPVYGPVNRAVFVETDDPVNAKLTFSITTIVE